MHSYKKDGAHTMLLRPDPHNYIRDSNKYYQQGNSLSPLNLLNSKDKFMMSKQWDVQQFINGEEKYALNFSALMVKSKRQSFQIIKGKPRP